MPAVLRDIGNPNVPLPEFLVVDTSLLLQLRPGSRPSRLQLAATDFLKRLAGEAVKGNILILVPLLVLEECYFKIIQWRYEAVSGAGFHNWHDLGYKQNPGLLRTIFPDLQTFRTAVLNLPAAITGPDDLILPHIADLPLEQQMLTNIRRFGVLPKDAYIIAEAERLGVTDLATADKDWDRADGFTVYRPM